MLISPINASQPVVLRLKKRQRATAMSSGHDALAAAIAQEEAEANEMMLRQLGVVGKQMETAVLLERLTKSSYV